MNPPVTSGPRSVAVHRHRRAAIVPALLPVPQDPVPPASVPPASAPHDPAQQDPAQRDPEPVVRDMVLSPRERAVLMAVAAGRCTLSPEPGHDLLVDGRPCADQFVGQRLLARGVARVVAQPPGRPSTVILSAAGVALLGLPITP